MKNILLIATLLISLTTLSQKPIFKTETTLENDGSISKTVRIYDGSLISCATLKAKIVNSDTVFYFVYRDMQYTHLKTYEVTKYLTKDDVINFFKYAHMIKDKVVDNAKCGDILVARGDFNSIIFYGDKGWGSLNLQTTENNFNYFITK
jgi:hypothetical protein